MTQSSPYQLFISGKCSCCDDVLAFLKREKIDIPVVNVDEDDYNLPFSIMIFPALVSKSKLLGYGCDDIISKLKNS